MQRLLLDSWPVLEWLKGRHPVVTRFANVLERARSLQVVLEMSRINYGEVIYSIVKAPEIKDKSAAIQAIAHAPLRLWSVDDSLVDEAVGLKGRYSISYADAFAAALAIRHGLPLVTGDREFRKLEIDGLLHLEWVGL